MKKLLTLVLAFVLGVCCLSLVACGSKTVSAGTYKFYSMSQAGVTVTVGTPEAEAAGYTADSFVMVLNEDGTVDYTMSMYGQTHTQEGTWTTDNGLTITIDGDSQVFNVDGDKISFSITEDGVTMSQVFKKV